MASIGSPESYVAVVRDGSDPATAYTEQAPILRELKWSKLQWGRVESDVSTSTITVPWDDSGGNCESGDLKGWDRVVGIYRNGILEWQGPIVGWTVGATGDLTIAAHDLFAWTKKRLLAADYSSSELDLMTLWDALILDVLTASSETVPWTLLRPTSVGAGAFGVKLTRDFKYAELRNLYEVVSQFRDDAGFYFTALPGAAFYSDSLLDRTSKPVLNERTVIDMAGVTVDCLETASNLYTGEDGAGASGYANVTVTPAPAAIGAYSAYDQDAVWNEQVGTNPIGNTSTSKARRLEAAARRAAPTVSIEELVLGPDFGTGTTWFNGMNTLIPGLVAAWRFGFTSLDVPNVSVRASNRTDYYDPSPNPWTVFTTVNYARLTEVAVSVEVGDSGEATEEVRASFKPWGGEG